MAKDKISKSPRKLKGLFNVPVNFQGEYENISDETLRKEIIWLENYWQRWGISQEERIKKIKEELESRGSIV